MQAQEIKDLLLKYQQNNCTAAEIASLEDWYLQKAAENAFSVSEMEAESAEAAMWARLKPSKKLKRTFKFQIAAAAAIVVIVSVAVYLFAFRTQVLHNAEVKINATPVKPGSNKAILTLANGKSIYLNNAVNNNELAKQAGVSVKNTNNELVYTVGENATLASRNEFNKIETPNGGQYQVSLPDGSKVWLNAASSLKYPVAFASNERVVQLTGEGYFEVAKDATRPFIVKTESQTVKVLGTHFNINCYANEANVKTTLLEGSIQLSLLNGKTTLVKPGQQVLATALNFAFRPVDAEQSIAWKNGLFNFNNEDLSSIMRKIARWYDVDIAYQDEPTNQLFYGSISKAKSIQTVLKLLTISGDVKFKLEGRRVLVMNK